VGARQEVKKKLKRHTKPIGFWRVVNKPCVLTGRKRKRARRSSKNLQGKDPTRGTAARARKNHTLAKRQHPVGFEGVGCVNDDLSKGGCFGQRWGASRTHMVVAKSARLFVSSKEMRKSRESNGQVSRRTMEWAISICVDVNPSAKQFWVVLGTDGATKEKSERNENHARGATSTANRGKKKKWRICRRNSSMCFPIQIHNR